MFFVTKKLFTYLQATIHGLYFRRIRIMIFRSASHTESDKYKDSEVSEY
jgi:hypothetical protein